MEIFLALDKTKAKFYSYQDVDSKMLWVTLKHNVLKAKNVRANAFLTDELDWGSHTMKTIIGLEDSSTKQIRYEK